MTTNTEKEVFIFIIILINLLILVVVSLIRIRLDGEGEEVEPGLVADEQGQRAVPPRQHQRWKNVQIPQIYLCYFFFGCSNFVKLKTRCSNST